MAVFFPDGLAIVGVPKHAKRIPIDIGDRVPASIHPDMGRFVITRIQRHWLTRRPVQIYCRSLDPFIFSSDRTQGGSP